MEKQKFNFKETLSKLVEDIKKDKKKMFFVVLIPLLLVVSIVIGIVMNNDEVETENTASDSLIIPVDTLGLKKSKKSDVYKKDFFAVGEEKEDTVEFFSDKKEDDNSVRIVSKSKSSGSHYVYSSATSNNVVKKGNSTSNKDDVYRNETSTKETKEEISKRKRVPTDGSGNLSYGSGGNSKTDMFRGVVANENKIVKTGSYVKIRIPQSVKVGTLTLPANSIVSGITSIMGERLKIDISSVRIGNETRAVKWTVYDEDGNLGLAIPASVINDIARDGTNDLTEEGGSKVEANVPVVGNVKVNLKRKMTEVAFVIPTGHRLYVKEIK